MQRGTVSFKEYLNTVDVPLMHKLYCRVFLCCGTQILTITHRESDLRHWR